MPPTVSNPFLKLIKAGKVSTPVQLRSAYRMLLMKSHPDVVGSDRLLEKHLTLRPHYEEARLVLQLAAGAREEKPGPVRVDHRLAYYQALRRLERIDKPYDFHRNRNLAHINELKSRCGLHFHEWNAMDRRLYVEADRDYDRLKAEKPSGPYMKNALAINVGPVFHNIAAYHLTGSVFYKNQVKQNLDAVLQKLTDHNCSALRALIELLIDDMKNGPAVFGDNHQAAREKHAPR